jgi:hypothetical protein
MVSEYPTGKALMQNFLWITRLGTSVIPQIDLQFLSRKLPASRLISHHFSLEQVVQDYDTFDHDMKVEILKVIVTNEIMMEKFLQTEGKESIPFPIITSMETFPDDTTRNSFRFTIDKSYVSSWNDNAPTAK